MELNKLNNSRFYFLIWHSVFWVLFALYESFVGRAISGRYQPWFEYVIFYILNISLFYAHAEMMVRVISSGKRAVWIIIFTLAEIPLYLLVKLLIEYILVKTGLDTARAEASAIVFIRNGLWRMLYFVGLSTAYGFMRISITRAQKISELDKQRLQSQLNEQELEKNLLSSENAFLKAQINQHFLFNMLSFIHSNVLKYSEKIGDLIISLSDLMRYAFTEPDPDGKVRLSGEVEHIENYLSLNQHRFNQQLNFDFKATGNIDDMRVISLLLVTIIENVFKYGDLQNPAYPAKIYINADGNKLHLHVDNSKLKRPHGHSSGIGMDNVQKRLELMYPGNYRLNINQDTDTYQLDLNINIPENDLLHY